MGVPDLLKFAARCTPHSIGTLPTPTTDASASSAAKAEGAVSFDYVIVDVTNAHQTNGLPRLRQLLMHPGLHVTKSIILVVDGQRRRLGSAREHRTIATTHQLDVDTNRLAVDLHAARGGRVSVHLSSRTCQGEGDFKVLNIHRSIVAKHLKDTLCGGGAPQPAPTFLLVSEDSDILCGVLCGPHASSVTIATTLHDTTFDFGLLRVQEVLSFIGQQADVLLFNLASAAATEAAQQQHALTAKTAQTKPPGAGTARLMAPPAPVHPRVSGEIGGAPPFSVSAALPDEPGRRKKVDGPMQAAGMRVTFDDDEEEAVAANGDSIDTATVADVATTTMASNVPSTSKPIVVLPADLSTSSYLLQSCLDFVFLFTLVKGNGVSPSLAKGATKVDIESLWKAYCSLKYPSGGPSDAVSAFLTIREPEEGSDGATIELNAKFLHDVLSSINYADTIAVVEERQQARDFLKYVVFTVFRYATGNLTDTRDEVGQVTAPTLASLMHILAAHDTRTYAFSILEPPEFAKTAPLGLDTIRATAMVGLTMVRGASGGTGGTVFAQDKSGRAEATTFQGIKIPKRMVTPRAGSGALAVPVGGGGLGGAAFVPSVGLGSTTYASDLAAINAAIKKAPKVTPLSTFAQLVDIWTYALAQQVPALQRVALAARQRQINASGASATSKGKKKPTPTSAAEESTSSAAPTKGRFSFELRRVVPIVTAASAADAEDRPKRGREPEASGHTDDTGSSAVDPSRAALLARMGVAVSYYSRPTAETLGPVPKRKRREMEKAAKMEKKQAAAAAAGGSGTSVSQAGDAKKKFKRLGKKERAKLAKTKTTDDKTAPAPSSQKGPKGEKRP